MIEGLFFERKMMQAGTMGTVQVHSNDLHCYAREKADGTLRLELVDQNGKTTHREIDVISKEDFASRFKPCSEHDCSFRKKTEDEIKKAKAKKLEETAEAHLNNKEYLSAEFEFNRALKFDEESVRSNYGIGKVYLETGRVEEAKKIFNKLCNIEALFDKENKHTFNDFGIDLRKQGMYVEAIDNYTKALTIDKNDEILYYNLARAYKEIGDFSSAVKNIEKALELKPDFREALDYLPHLKNIISSIKN